MVLKMLLKCYGYPLSGNWYILILLSGRLSHKFHFHNRHRKCHHYVLRVGGDPLTVYSYQFLIRLFFMEFSPEGSPADTKTAGSFRFITPAFLQDILDHMSFE